MGDCSRFLSYHEPTRRAMKAILDLRSVHEGMTGIGRYALNLLQSIRASDPSLPVEVITSPAGRSVIGAQEGVRVHAVSGAGPGWDDLSLPDLLRTLGAQLYHTPLFVLPSVRACKYVCTVHDVIPVVRPDLTHESFSKFFHKYIGKALRCADHVVAVSEFSRQDVLKAFRLDKNRISAVHESVDPIFSRSAASDDERFLKEEFELKPGFILSVGAIDRRKNLKGLLDAYALLGKAGPVPPLAVVGASSGDDFDLSDEIRKRKFGYQVRVLGRVSDDALARLYSNAAFLAFPSFYEGFGLPVVEAMAAGTPVVTSSASSLPEVAGDAALLVDPADADALAGAMRRLLEDRELREELARKGRCRAERFSLKRHGEELIALYRRVLGIAA